MAPVVIGTTALAQDADVERGRYLATIMDCGGCHTRGIFMGKPDPDLFLAGSEVGFHLPGLGYFYPPNLTPDPATGLGEWSEDDIVRAVRTGERPDGRILAPIMPFHSYAALTDEDAYALAGFLKSMPPKPFAEEPQPAGEGEPPPGPYLEVIVP
ncbi:MAG TPA: c-type cytochrome [Alphaproteobacteria bacterium]|nr:c-type cytochrome [Alphaproteobacteria bacterium]